MDELERAREALVAATEGLGKQYLQLSKNPIRNAKRLRELDAEIEEALRALGLMPQQPSNGARVLSTQTATMQYENFRSEQKYGKEEDVENE